MSKNMDEVFSEVSINIDILRDVLHSIKNTPPTSFRLKHKMILTKLYTERLMTAMFEWVILLKTKEEKEEEQQ